MKSGHNIDLSFTIVRHSCIAEVTDKVLDAASFYWEKMRENMFRLIKKQHINVPKAQAIKGKDKEEESESRISSEVYSSEGASGWVG